jgi:hypothetical protein
MTAEFDRDTLANMMAALEYVCKRIPPERDTDELRKRIGGAVIAAVRDGQRTLDDLQQAGMRALQQTPSASTVSWFSWMFR